MTSRKGAKKKGSGTRKAGPAPRQPRPGQGAARVRPVAATPVAPEVVPVPVPEPVPALPPPPRVPLPAPPPRPGWAALRPRGRRSEAVVALLAALLGFALVVQVRATRSSEGFSTAREEDLVRILDDLSQRSERLRREVEVLEGTRDRLTSGSGRTEAAVEETRRRAEALGILAGTLPAEGPGITLTITDPQRRVRADLLLDTLEELRGAGAEALSVGPVRLVTTSAFVDRDGRVLADGVALAPPYRFTALGDPDTLATAAQIPGGVVDAVRQVDGADVAVRSGDALRITALKALKAPRYARPDPAPGAGDDGAPPTPD